MISLLVVQEYVWYPDRLGAGVYGFNAAIFGRIPFEKRVVPFLSEKKRQVFVRNHSEFQIWHGLVHCTVYVMRDYK